MNNHEWHAWRPAGRNSGGHNFSPEYYHKPSIPETTLREMFIEDDRKIFALALKENMHGRFLRITEETNGRFNSIIVPVGVLEDLLTVIIEMVQIHKNQPAGDQPDNPPA